MDSIEKNILYKINERMSTEHKCYTSLSNTVAEGYNETPMIHIVGRNSKILLSHDEILYALSKSDLGACDCSGFNVISLVICNNRTQSLNFTNSEVLSLVKKSDILLFNDYMVNALMYLFIFKDTIHFSSTDLSDVLLTVPDSGIKESIDSFNKILVYRDSIDNFVNGADLLVSLYEKMVLNNNINIKKTNINKIKI